MMLKAIMNNLPVLARAMGADVECRCDNPSPGKMRVGLGGRYTGIYRYWWWDHDNEVILCGVPKGGFEVVA